ncbi:hypothetical protein FACS1894105_05430 [Clostridia bacterium]|nr:hypothetical protein FACS1894105_05430 [Clostridia bacterium]
MEPKEILLELRKKNGLSQDKMAEKLFVTRQAISRWENGETVPNTDTLKIISKTFDVSVNTLLGQPHVEKPVINPLLTRTIPELTDPNGNDYISGNRYDEDSVQGNIVRTAYHAILRAAAHWHGAFWENTEAIEQTGLDWRHKTKENLASHISAMEYDYKKYKRDEESGKIPKVFEGECDGNSFRFENRPDMQKPEYYAEAIDRLKIEYAGLLESRFESGKNVTVIHGDMHPGTAYISKSGHSFVKFKGLQAVRTGLCTEDLAMLIALHIEPDKQKALPLLDFYYKCLCEKVSDYPYEIFMRDYKISVTENLFFPVRLINRKIYDFKMRDKAIRAFETFVRDSD